jgi:DHA1 family multidrug resistance protein-like MFS transporter
MKARRLRKAEPKRNQDIYAEHENLDWSFAGVIHRTIYRPFYMLYKEPILVLVTIYLSIVYGVLYGRESFLSPHQNQCSSISTSVFEALPVIFIQKRGFTIPQNGLIFIGVGIGSTIGALFNVLFSSRYPLLLKEWKGFPPPEERLYGAMLAGPSLVIGIFWLGWTGQYPAVPWYVPAISTVLIGMSVALIFASLLSYLIDTYV